MAEVAPRGADVAYDRLKAEIISGVLAEGESIIEVDTAARLSMSRTPIREALRRLQHDGLVVATVRGMAVRARSPEEIVEVYEARIVLETAVARAAANRRTDTDLVRLTGLLRRAEALPTDRPDVLAAANLELHRAIWAASHNGALADLLERVNVHLTRYPATTLSYPGRWARALAQHAEIVDAIAAAMPRPVRASPRSTSPRPGTSGCPCGRTRSEEGGRPLGTDR